MLEIRLCSLVLAEWLQGVHEGPWTPAPQRPLAAMFGNKAKVWAAEPRPDISECRGLVAYAGPRFESSELVVSVVHTLGIAAAAKGQPSQAAYRIQAFVEGTDPYVTFPACLATVGVKSALRQAEAIEFRDWIRSVDEAILKEEVESMFGRQAVPVYALVKKSLDTIFDSVTTHHADLCCLKETT
jgi:hypothetical protein